MALNLFPQFVFGFELIGFENLEIAGRNLA
jgi:hypothetical protein